MKKCFLFFCLIFFINNYSNIIFAETSVVSVKKLSSDSSNNISIHFHDDNTVPLFSTLFHDFGKNTIGSFTYGYGLPLIIGTAGTYGFVKSGADWEWNRFNVRYHNLSLFAPLFGVGVGSVAPVFAPLIMYFWSDNTDIQFTGLALGQAAMQGALVSSMIKTITGRVPPHISDAVKGDKHYQDDYSADFRFGFWRGGIVDGWPSGHTSVAVAMSTTLITLYPDSFAIKVGAIAYSAFIGFSMSMRAHWASDVFAGAFTGFAIGRTVGKSYAALRDGRKREEKVSLAYYGNGLGLHINL